MAATAVLPRHSRSSSDRPAPARGVRAAAYERVLHQLVRRELRMLAELVTWADPADAEHTSALTRHADLVGRVLLHHHAVERDLLWPALLRALPEDSRSAARARVDDWTARCARVDAELRDVATAARQWAVAGTAAARDAFALACLDVADAVDAQVDEEEAQLLPLLAAHLSEDGLARRRPRGPVPAAGARAAARARHGAGGPRPDEPLAAAGGAVPGRAAGVAAAWPFRLPRHRRPAARSPAGALTPVRHGGPGSDCSPGLVRRCRAQ